ncbi:hypothetical protein FY034_00100 [Trichlorobacter lovleyi]|uniref:hypothetical protein n=1 Tax=Trichlorobacter lovleyi TaxID=313985 RepID=UPI00223ECDE6|nr:hypothetical protein [Trichlorobacter lovleyi]QOX77408.1 hypothetical protein FY034_00100 [Trichlorobacter lovleyi]
MAVRFKRCFDDEIIEAMEKFGVKNLIKAIQDLRPEGVDPSLREFAFDIHMRENNELMVYYAGTCLLVISFNLATQGKVRFKSKSYSTAKESDVQEKQDCAKSFSVLKEAIHLDCLEGTTEKIKHFLLSAVKVANASKRKFFNGASEGYWSSRLSIEFGRKWASGKKWLILDRESILGFEDPVEKSDGDRAIFMEDIDCAVESTKEDLAQDHKWAKDCSKPFGNELDFLAIGEDKQLICIELKIAKNGDGIAWGPLQAAVYQKSFSKATADPEIVLNIKKMVRQKVQLGILPTDALNLIPSNGFESATSVLAVTDGKDPASDEYWKRAREVNDLLKHPLSRSSIFKISCTADGKLFLKDVTTTL